MILLNLTLNFSDISLSDIFSFCGYHVQRLRRHRFEKIAFIVSSMILLLLSEEFLPLYLVMNSNII